ncbi:MAG: amidohydrolase family protein, partial [Xanthomonadales bacterium]|nr:amidohydrolase family protein [Xanthomonadales bacterium]
WYFLEGPQRIQELQVSPDGRWVLARSLAQQLHVFPAPPGAGGDETPTVDLTDPQTVQQQITRKGADFFGWADGGRTITWALGSTWYRCALEPVTRETAAGVAGAGPLPERGCRSPESFDVPVEVPRDTPEGDLVLRGATVLTMNGDEAIEDADLHIRNDRIAAIGARGELDLPSDTQVISAAGRYIVPGFIETHIHLADIRRDVIEFASWGAAASLAYGVTSVFDPSSLSIDMLVYEDLVDAGLIVGARIHSTGPAIFDFHAFASPDEIRDVLLRYRDHYRTRNVKMYRTGNRRVRQWLAVEARDLGMLPTTEGALAMKLGLTQVLDGYMGLEHELAAQPLGHDVVELMARSGAAYSPTLVISAGPDAEHWFIARDDPASDPKMQRFWPGFARDWKLRHTTWHTFEEYSFPAAAAGAAEIFRAGGTVGVGAHGNIPGLGYQWEMQALAMGGMTPGEVLQAATVHSARAIGRLAEFGTLEPGKYADLVVLERDPREDIVNTLTIRQVMKNGRLYDGDTLDEIWPRQRAFPTPWYAEEELE